MCAFFHPWSGFLSLYSSTRGLFCPQSGTRIHPSVRRRRSNRIESNRTNERRMSAKKQRTFKLRAKDFEVGCAVADARMDGFGTIGPAFKGVGKIEICSRFSAFLRRNLSSTSTSARGDDNVAIIGVVVTHRRSMFGFFSRVCLGMFVCLFVLLN